MGRRVIHVHGVGDEIVWEEAKHPRKGTGPGGGEFTRGAGGGSGGKTVVHVHGGTTFASPNLRELPSLTPEHAILTAKAGLATRRQKLFERAAADVDKELGIRSLEAPAIGAWSDGAENTTMMMAPDATADQLRLSAAMKGWLGQQKAVLSFSADPKGKGVLYHGHVTGDLGDIHRALLSRGIENHTLVPRPGGQAATVYIADTDGSAAKHVSRYATGMGIKLKAVRGNAEFLGAEHYKGTTDAEQRAEGRAAYERVIAQSGLAGDRGGAAAWGRLRDRWAETLQQTQDRRAGGAALLTADQTHVWVEAQHPRKGKGAGGGEFTTGSGGSGGGSGKAAVSPLRPAPDEPPAALPDKLQTLIDRSDYEVTVEPKTGKWFTPGTRAVTLKPKQPEGWKTSAKGEVYDPKYVTEDPEFGSTALKDREAGEFPGKKVEGSIWRGMSQEEYQQALKQGFFKSLGDYNIGGQQAGLTYFSHDPRQAASYAHGFAPWQYAGTIKQPPVVVRVKDPGGHIDVAGTDPNEVGIGKPVATSAIEEVWQGKPVIIPGGEGEIDPEGKMGNFSVQRPYVVWEKQPDAAKQTVSPLRAEGLEGTAGERVAQWEAKQAAKRAGLAASGDPRYQGVGDKPFTGPHADENAEASGRLLGAAENRHAAEQSVKHAGMTLVDATQVTPQVAEAFELETYRDGSPKPTLWFEDTKVMADGVEKALADLHKQGFSALEKELKENVNVVFARPKVGSRSSHFIAAVWSDPAGKQWMVINAANTLDKDWSPTGILSGAPNTIGAQNAQEAYELSTSQSDEAKRAAQALALHHAIIHESGHVLDNMTGLGMSAGLEEVVRHSVRDGADAKWPTIVRLPYPPIMDWVENRLSTYAASDPREAAAEAWTLAVTQPKAKKFPKELKVWRDSVLQLAKGEF